MRADNRLSWWAALCTFAPNCTTRSVQDKRRVVVGINVFDTSIGAQVAAAPIHSGAYLQARGHVTS